MADETGFYDPIRKLFNRTLGIDPKAGHMVTAVTAGAVTGMIGGTYGFLIQLIHVWDRDFLSRTPYNR